MSDFPTLETDRLRLRLVEPSDAEQIYQLLQDTEIAMNTLALPHPYELKHAHEFIKAVRQAASDAQNFTFGMEHRAEGHIIGMIGMNLHEEHRRSGVGYWLGKAYWRQGYTSEALRRVVQHGFEDLNLNKIYGYCFKENVGSARVLQKAGMVYEGTFLQHYYHKLSDSYKDAACYGITRAMYDGKTG